jgi:deoxyribonucleoside regulator
MAVTDSAVANELLAVRAAELYYEENKTQDEIGAILRVTRWKVGRLLQQARDRGIIRIEIVHPRARRLALERELTARFGLRDAIVVPAPTDDVELQARVAEAAADFLVSVRPIPRLLGVSWGRTLHQVAECLPEGWSTGVNVVQINGGVSLSKRPGTAASTAVMIAQKAGGEATLLPTPAILERLETKRAIEGDRTVSGVIQRARGAAAYLYSAGVADTSSVHVDSGYLTTDDIENLVDKGAVGDVLGRYITTDGTIADPELDARTLGLGLDELRNAAMSILVIGGEAKHSIAHAVVRHGLCSVLVTDEHTARALLDAGTDSTASGEDPS